MSNFLHNILDRTNAVGRTLDDDLLGLIGMFPDEKKEAAGARGWYTVSGGHVVCRLVKNSSGGTLDPGKAVKYAAGKDFMEVSGYAGAGEVADGFVDPYVHQTSVAAGAHFLIVVAGRLVSAKSASETYSVGDLVKTGAAGVVTAAAAISDAGFCGKVQAATASNGDDVEIIIQLRESINLTNLQ